MRRSLPTGMDRHRFSKQHYNNHPVKGSNPRQFKVSGSKDAVSKELANLRSQELKGDIKILGLKNDLVNFDKMNLPRDEDKIILAIAQLTNSVLMTADQVLKDRALLEERPTIFIPARVFGKIKVIEEVRNP